MTHAVAISGASGFVGRVLCPHLAHRGYEVKALGRSELASDGLRELLSGTTTVIHLAARAHILDETDSDPELVYRQSNVVLTQQLGRAAKLAGVRRFIFVSSAGVLGATSPREGFDDATVPRPHDAYTRTKLEAEHWLQSQLSPHLDVAIVRPPLIYGPHAKGNLMRLMRIALRGWPLPIGSLRAPRSLVSVRNLADLLETIVAARTSVNSAMLVADRESICVADLYGTVARIAGHRPWLAPVPQAVIRALLQLSGRSEDVARLTGAYLLRPSIATLQLGWDPPYSLEQELRWMVAAELSGDGPP